MLTRNSVAPRKRAATRKRKKKLKLDEKSLPSGRYDFAAENFIKGPSASCLCGGASSCGQPVSAYNPLFNTGHPAWARHLLNASGGNQKSPGFQHCGL